MAKRSEVHEFIRFCSKHGVTVNKETIWHAVKRQEAVLDAMKRRLCGVELLSSRKPSQQLELSLGTPSRIT